MKIIYFTTDQGEQIGINFQNVTTFKPHGSGTVIAMNCTVNNEVVRICVTTDFDTVKSRVNDLIGKLQ